MNDRLPLVTKRGALALFAGLLATAVPPTVIDAFLHATGVFPSSHMSDRLFLLALAYRTAFAVAGAYVTARVATSRPMGHALALGAVGTVLGTIGLVATWGRPEFGPSWYPAVLVATAVPSTWLGGRLGRRARGGRPAGRLAALATTVAP
jgi:hypothetical protein